MRKRTEGPLFAVGPSDSSTKPGRLVCDGDGGGFDFGRLRDDAELLHHSQSFPVDPSFHDFAASKTGDGYPGDVDLPPRWRNPAEIPFMGTPAGPTGHYCFAFGKDVPDHQMKVGKSSAVESSSFLFTLRAAPKIECRGVMMFVGGSKELVCHRQIALVPEFFNQTTDVSLVVF